MLAVRGDVSSDAAPCRSPLSTDALYGMTPCENQLHPSVRRLRHGPTGANNAQFGRLRVDGSAQERPRVIQAA